MEKAHVIEHVRQTLQVSSDEGEQIASWILHRLGRSLEKADTALPVHFEYIPEELEQKKDTSFVDSILISVDCEENDSVDIRCGGPEYLGYDFIIEKNAAEEIKSFVQRSLKEQGKPFLRITEQPRGSSERHQLWTKTDIEMEMYKGYDGKRKPSFSLFVHEGLLFKS